MATCRGQRQSRVSGASKSSEETSFVAARLAGPHKDLQPLHPSREVSCSLLDQPHLSVVLYERDANSDGYINSNRILNHPSDALQHGSPEPLKARA
jgi:hypothetical protein